MRFILKMLKRGNFKNKWSYSFHWIHKSTYSSSEETKSDEDGNHSSGDGDLSKEKTKKDTNTVASALSKTSPDTTAGQDLVDGQTPKERECYRLFQKMSNMGLSVSYDTILRGMLTPTELRVLQKQRSKTQTQQGSRQNSSETEINETNDNSKNDGTNLIGSINCREGYEVVAIEQVSEEPATVEQWFYSSNYANAFYKKPFRFSILELVQSANCDREWMALLCWNQSKINIGTLIIEEHVEEKV